MLLMLTVLLPMVHAAHLWQFAVLYVRCASQVMCWQFGAARSAARGNAILQCHLALVALSPTPLVLGTILSPKSRAGTTLELPTTEPRHLRLVGISGSGKSRLLAVLVLELLNVGIGFCLVDPHGDLCDLILAYLQSQCFFAHPQATHRLWYVDFTRDDAFVPFNVLDGPYPPHVKARNVWEAWSRAWPGIGGGNAPNMQNLVLASVYVLAVNHRPLTDLQRLLTDRAFRERLLARCEDAQVVAFFHERYDALGRRAAMLNEPALRRGFILGFVPALFYALCQAANRIAFRSLMDRGVSLLCNLGGLDPDTQRFLGALLCIGFEEAALSRVDLPPQARRPFVLAVDEFSHFSAQSAVAMERILALARKYGLSLVLAHQTSSQVTRGLEGALGNATSIVFRTGRSDASLFADQLFTHDPYRVKHVVADPYQQSRSHPMFMSASEQRSEFEQELLSLPPREAYVRLGNETLRFRSIGLPDPAVSPVEVQAIKERYAQLLLTPRAQIEAQDAQWDAALSSDDNRTAPSRRSIPMAQRGDVAASRLAATSAAEPEPTENQEGGASGISSPAPLPPARRRRTAPLADEAGPGPDNGE